MVRLRLTPAGQAAIVGADEAYAGWLDDLLEHTGHRDELLANFLLLNEAMTERRRGCASVRAADVSVSAADVSAADVTAADNMAGQR